MPAPLSMIYVGTVGGTCQHRASAMARLGHRVERVVSDMPAAPLPRLVYRVGWKTGWPPDLTGVNRRLVELARTRPIDVLWADKPHVVRPRTLREIRRLRPGIRMAAYSPDDMINPQNQTRWYLATIPLFDLHVTTKSYNVPELRELGARDVLFVDNAFEPPVHRPMELTGEDRERFGADVSFVGGYERERAELMLGLAEAGIPVDVWGYHWNKLHRSHSNLRVRDQWLHEHDFSKCVSASRINLGFLRKINRDLQTQRSVEIPACGGFMLAERSDEHRRLFEEGVEAAFFSSPDELRDQCRYWLAHENERARVAAAGRRRCLESDYSNDSRMRQALEHLERLAPR